MTAAWPEVALGDVATIERRVVEPHSIRAGTMYVGLENVVSGGGLRDVRPVAEGELASGKFAFDAGHVLFGKLRPNLAKSARPDFAGVCSTDILPIRPGPSLDRDYLALFIASPGAVALATQRATGANLPRLSPRELERFQLPLPPLDEQRRIARLLDSACALRTKRRTAIGQLDGLASSLFEALFIDPCGRWRCPAVLGDHLLFITSGARGWARYYAEQGTRFIRSLDVRMNAISDGDVVFVSPPDNAEARRTRVMRGDVLLTITGSRIGRVAAVTDALEGTYVSQHVAILRPDQQELSPRFLAFFLSSRSGGQPQIAQSQYGQTKPGLNFEQIRAFDVPVPPISLQREFVRRTEQVDAVRTAQARSVGMFDQLIASLQHRGFNGEL